MDILNEKQKPWEEIKEITLKLFQSPNENLFSQFDIL